MGFFDIFKKDKRTYSENERREMLKEQRHHCARCGKRINIRTSEGDHITPYSAGGRTDKWNGQMLCRKCHVQKSNSERGVYYGKPKNPFRTTKSEHSSYDFFGSSRPKKRKQKNDDGGFGNFSGADFFGSNSTRKRKKRKSDDWSGLGF